MTKEIILNHFVTYAEYFILFSKLFVSFHKNIAVAFVNTGFQHE